jgi:hypothetical protein
MAVSPVDILNGLEKLKHEKIGESNQRRSYKEMLVRDSMTDQKYNMMTIVIEKIPAMSHIFALSGSLLQDKPKFCAHLE